MQLFEYRTLKIEIKYTLKGAVINHENINVKLNELGAQGWELTSSIPNHNSGTLKELVLIFKKKLPIES